MSEQIDLAKRLEVAVESNEKYRSRARAVSTLCAAAAGALAAGLILAPTDTLPELAQVFGLIAITLLIVATALSLAASSAISYQASKKTVATILRFLEVWRIRTQSPNAAGSSATYDELIHDAGVIKSGIIRTLSLGLWSASLAALLLIASLSVATFSGESSRTVSLELSEYLEVASCPGLGKVFLGEVQDRDLASNVTLLKVSVSAAECGNKSGATLFLEKSLVAIVS